MGEIQRCRRFAVYDIEVRPWKTLTDEEKLNIEISENVVRKQFSWSETIEYGRRLERIEAAKAKERMSDGGKGVETFPQVGKTRDAVAEQLGIGSGKQYEKEKTIVDNKDLISAKDFADWDEGKLSTNKAFQKDTRPQKAPPEPGHRRVV